MAPRKSSPRRRPASEGRMSLGKIFNRRIFDVTHVSTGGRRLLGGGVRGFVGALIALALSAAISIVALVMICLVYTQIEPITSTAASTITTYATASLSLGVIALGLQVIGAFIRPDSGWGSAVNMIIMAAYIIAGVLALLVAVGLPDSTLQTYALVAAAFYIFIGGAYM